MAARKKIDWDRHVPVSLTVHPKNLRQDLLDAEYLVEHQFKHLLDHLSGLEEHTVASKLSYIGYAFASLGVKILMACGGKEEREGKMIRHIIATGGVVEPEASASGRYQVAARKAMRAYFPQQDEDSFIEGRREELLDAERSGIPAHVFVQDFLRSKGY